MYALVTVFKLNIEDKKGETSDSSRLDLISKVKEDRKFQLMVTLFTS